MADSATISVPNTGSGSQKASSLIQEANAMRAERRKWEPLHQRMIDDYAPSVTHVLEEMEFQDGQDRPGPINKIGVLSNRKYAAGMSGHTAPPNQRWGTYKESRKELADLQEVKNYYDSVTDLFFEKLNGSNFQQINYENFEQAGSVGTVCVLFTRGRRSAFHFRIVPIGTWDFKQDYENRPIAVYRWFKYTVAQAVSEWGEEVVRKSPQMSDVLDSKDVNSDTQKFEFLHVVKHRNGFDPTKRDAANMPWESIYLTVGDQTIIEESGFTSNPYIIYRAFVRAPEKWGRSNGMECSDELELAADVKKDRIVAVHKHVNPATLVPDDSPYRIRNMPGGKTLFQPGKEPQEWQSVSRPDIGKDLQEEQHEIIEKFFHIDLFNIFDSIAFTGSKQPVTATEIFERKSEKFVNIAPEIGRALTEWYTPIFLRGFDILNELRLLPQPPQALGPVANFKVEFNNIIMQSMRLLKNQEVLGAIQQISPILDIQPEVLDNFDLDEISRSMYDNSGALSRGMRSEDIVEQIRTSRAQAAQAEQASALANQAADTVNKLPDQAQKDVIAEFKKASGL